MDLSNDDLQLLVNEKNKEIYQTLYDLVIKEYENILDGSIPEESKHKSWGTYGVYLSSISELLHATNDLVNKGFLESAGCIVAALWERFITLRMILINPEENSQIHVDHEQLKKTPWSVGEMVKAVIENEHKIKPKSKKDIESKLYYLQYTFFCAIKHGNPYTISYLNRPDRSSIEKLFVIKPNDNYEDRDLKYYFLWLLMEIALDTLMDYCKYYNIPKIKIIQELIRLVTETAKYTPLDVPKIILASPNEYDKEFWNVLEELDKRF
jgi:hypothetical protein